MDITGCTLLKEDGINVFRVLVEWSCDTSFRITVLDQEHVWCGKVSRTQVTEMSQQLALSPEAYISESRKALSTQGGATNFVYVLENEQFMWKKLVDNNTHIRIRFGSAIMELVPTLEVTTAMIDSLIASNQSVKESLNHAKEEKKKLESENQQLLNKLDELVAKKSQMEAMLYSNFLDILNAKKKRIRRLEEHIEGVADSDPDVEEVEAKNKKASIGKRVAAISEEKTTKPTKKAIVGKHSAVISEEKSTKPVIKRKSSTKQTIQPLSKKSQEIANHYDSDTDVDPCTDDEAMQVVSSGIRGEPSNTCDTKQTGAKISCDTDKVWLGKTCDSEKAGLSNNCQASDQDAMRERLLDELGV